LNDTPLINSHNSWSQLQEVWLGDIYPREWYDHLPPDVRDVFYYLTDITKQDLGIIQNTLESFGVTVRRPVYQNKELYMEQGQLIKPQICPRDHFVVLGNKIITELHLCQAWRPALDHYAQDPQCGIVFKTDHVIGALNGANIVRLNQRLIIDSPVSLEKLKEFDCLQDYEITMVNNGGHLDGCFAVLKPGLLLAGHYFDDYDRTFPGWQKIILDQPEFHTHQGSVWNRPKTSPNHNGKWWFPGQGHHLSFNEHIIAHAQDWVGDYTETYFDLNCLVINEANVVMLGYNQVLEQVLQGHDITVHWVPFRTRTFWDGGMHCLTLDIRRSGSLSPEHAQ
jgi:hypothetical protein